jgi:hypothetical protein
VGRDDRRDAAMLCTVSLPRGLLTYLARLSLEPPIACVRLPCSMSARHGGSTRSRTTARPMARALPEGRYEPGQTARSSVRP